MPPADLPFPVRHCDPADRQVVAGRRLPHSAQAGAISFITWRTADSLPSAVLDRLAAERAEWLRGRGGDVARLTPTAAFEYKRFTRSRWNHALDSGLGACPLRDPACAGVVADALRHFDGDRYILFDFVVMPNHVHVLAAFPDTVAMRRQCESWKHFTAVGLNRRLGRTGRFWQEECFDYLTRSDAQFVKLREYIAMNPVRAGLSAGEYTHYSRDLAGFGFDTVPSRPLAERAGNISEHAS